MKNKNVCFLLVLVLIFSFNITAFAGVDGDDPKKIDELDPITNEKEAKKIETRIEEDLSENKTSAKATALPSTPQSALDITSYYPAYTRYSKMSEGSEGYVKFTPKYNGTYAFYTTGSLDTYIEIYDSVSLTNMLDSDDDSGQGNNAMENYQMSKQKTYYIKIRGYDSSQTGSFIFGFNRGLARSTYEDPDNISRFNNYSYKEYNNCYTYALNYWVNPVSGRKFRVRGQNPGEMAGNSIGLKDLKNADTVKTSFLKACKADAKYYGGDFKEISRWEQPDVGYYKVSLVFIPNNDYHWYRQIPNGRFAHKRGLNSAKDVDESGKYIYFPEDDMIDMENYKFVAYYQVKTPNINKSILPSIPDNIDEEVYPIKKDLSIENFKVFNTNTSIDEVKSVVGQEHGTVGSGLIGELYNLIDGTNIVVYYRNNKVDQIRILNDDNSYEIIVE